MNARKKERERERVRCEERDGEATIVICVVQCDQIWQNFAT